MKAVCWTEGPGLCTWVQGAKEHLAKSKSEALPSALVFTFPLTPFTSKPIFFFLFFKRKNIGS